MMEPKKLFHGTLGLTTIDIDTWHAKRPCNLILTCQNLQGDADLIFVATALWRSVKITLGRSSFFDNGKHAWAKFDWRLFH